MYGLKILTNWLDNIYQKTNFDNINNLEIKYIQYKINNRPRKKLNFYLPKEIFS